MKNYPASMIAAVATLAAALLPAQQGDAAAATATIQVKLEQGQQEPFVIPAGEMKLDELISAAGRYLKINILLNPQECANGGMMPIKFDRKIETDRDGCEDLLTSLLYRSGFALLPLDKSQGLYEVIMMTGTRGREITNRAERKTVEQVLARPNLYVPVLVSVKLNHINAQLANNALRPFFASAGGSMAGGSLLIGNVGNNSALLLQGFQAQVVQAIQLLQECDVPRAETAEEPSLQQRIEQLEQRIAKLEALLTKSKD